MSETSRKETMFDKSDNVKEEQKSLKSGETPEEKQQQEADNVSRKFLKNSDPDRAGDTMAFASIQSASDSYNELQNAPSWQDNTIDQAAKDGITAKYKGLVEGPNGFDAKVQGILEKYANQPEKAKDLQEELFQAQKQFAVDLGRVASEANGIINGTPASKDAANKEQQARERKIAEKEQLRFAESMQKMIELTEKKELAARKAKEMEGQVAEQNKAAEQFPIEFPGVKV
ncbi:MAG: hypothetical protein PHU93_03060 [Candidatus Gracilibacteria bacterium]|nr:hypothetical protein [Candidatus Gracilibacteria bacterium]